MILPAIAMALAASAAQASDTTRAAREAFTSCLRAYVDRSLESGMSADAFATAFPRQCATQEAAFREVIIRRETTARSSRADAEEAAGLEIEDARVNFSERFDMSSPAPQQRAAEPEPEEQPQPDPQAEPQQEEPQSR